MAILSLPLIQVGQLSVTVTGAGKAKLLMLRAKGMVHSEVRVSGYGSGFHDQMNVWQS